MSAAQLPPQPDSPPEGSGTQGVGTRPWMTELLTQVPPVPRSESAAQRMGVSATLAGSLGSERTSLSFRQRSISC